MRKYDVDDNDWFFENFDNDTTGSAGVIVWLVAVLLFWTGLIAFTFWAVGYWGA